MSSQPINTHRFEGGHHHITTGDPEELSRQDPDRTYGKLELRNEIRRDEDRDIGIDRIKSAAFRFYRGGDRVGSISPPLRRSKSYEKSRFVAHEIYRVRPFDITNFYRTIARFRDHEYHHDPLDIPDDSIFKTLFDHVAQDRHEAGDFKFGEKIERTTRSLSVLRPDLHFFATRTRISDGSVEAFRCWMYYQNNCIIEEVADLEDSDD